MEEKSLQDYDESLRELEQQRILLERVMEKMGQEWEESGAGIAWLGSLDLPHQNQNEDSEGKENDDTMMTATATTMTPSSSTILEDLDCLSGSLSASSVKHTESEIFKSPDYGHQSALDANETLPVQSHRSPSNAASTPTTPDEYPHYAVFGSIAKTLEATTTSTDPVIVSASGLSQDLQHNA